MSNIKALLITQKALEILFYAVFFITPLIVFPKSSEVFEFTKLVFVYIATILAIAFFLAGHIIKSKSDTKKMITFGQLLFVAILLLYLFTQTLATITSEDLHMSIFGYYGRFSGGLLSTISYTIFSIIFVFSATKKTAIRSIKFFLTSAFLVSTIAVVEHYGYSLTCILASDRLSQVNYSCWQQDFKTRVFSTLGQANWLAAWITAIIPISWAISFSDFRSPNSKSKVNDKWKMATGNYLTFFLSILFFSTLLFTKSRSGLLAFFATNFIFWSLIFLFTKNITIIKKHVLHSFIIHNLLFIILAFAIGTPWTPNLKTVLKVEPSQQLATDSNPQPVESISENSQATNPTVVITDSLAIRKIVWKGAMNIWKDNKLLGTGIETFGISYPKYRPVEHNLTSEWDFLYNKAHNEYLNLLANSGIVGISGYILLLIIMIFSFFNFHFPFSIFSNIREPKSDIRNPISEIRYLKSDIRKTEYLRFALFSGWVSLLITNFFGFSVVATSLIFFSFPAISIALNNKTESSKLKSFSISKLQVLLVCLCFLFVCYFLVSTIKYWKADYLFAAATYAKENGNHIESRKLALEAISLSPNESVYWSNLSDISAELAVSFAENTDDETSHVLSQSATLEAQRAITLSPSNVYYLRNYANILIKMAGIKTEYVDIAKDTLIKASNLSPTDAKLKYNLGVVQSRTGENEAAKITLLDAINVKENYKDPRYALAVLLMKDNKNDEAKYQLEYIVKNIDPFDIKVNELLHTL